MVQAIVEHPSPNHGERSLPVSMIVIHYTETEGCDEALRTLCDPSSPHPVSAHYLIDRDGTSYRLVDESRRAWHAGRSFWKGIEDCNSASIGIELVNSGSEAFPSAQIGALASLCADIMARHAITDIVGHSDIAPGRKRDPGPLFPWKAFLEMLDSYRRTPNISTDGAIADMAAEISRQRASSSGDLALTGCLAFHSL